MSGVKYSTIQLAQERKAVQDALGQIQLLNNSVNGLKEKVNVMLAEIPAGVKASFPTEIQSVNRWLASAMPTHSNGMTSGQLNNVVSQLKTIDDNGKLQLTQLIEVKERKRDKKARELLSELELLKGELMQIKNLLDKWTPNQFSAIMEKLNRCYGQIDLGDFIATQNALNLQRSEITLLAKEVTELQSQDEQRWYALESLKKVCENEIGWGQHQKPALENSGDPKSPIVYEVNTYGAGILTFRLTLEGIQADSPISSMNDMCYKEFGNISERLANFGVQTKFERLPSPDEDPKLFQKGELDLPDDGVEIASEVSP
jgi:hypothetical protein